MVESYLHTVGMESSREYDEAHKAIGRCVRDHSQILHVELRRIYANQDTIRIVRQGAYVH